MAKKHWIYIKRGLSEDPKHRAAMGECVWLFMHIIDRADWETGIAYDWKDREEAAEMSMSAETLRDQRQKLEKLDYIRCSQKQRGQDIQIMEWRNPRDYGSEIKNPRVQGDALPLPTDFQGDAHGDAQVSSQPTTPSSDSISQSHSLSEEENQQVNDKVEAIIRGSIEAKKMEKAGKSWNHREKFQFNEHILAFADKCAQRFGEPTKKDISLWVEEIGSWVDAGGRVGDWERAVEIVSGYSQPVISITGMTKAIKFAIQERKNGIQAPREEYHPEYRIVRADPEEDKKYTPMPENLRRRRS